MAQHKSVGMFCLDLTSAFDCFRHDALLYKMSSLRFPLFLRKIVDSFLSGRMFGIAVGHSSSTVRNMLVGVPQGSVISLTLFNIYVVHDIPVPPEMYMAQLADDSAYITASHRTSTIVSRLQSAANQVTRYFNKWGVRVTGP